MQKPAFDPGLTEQFKGPLRRVINKDGRFNVRRRGTNWRDFNPYLQLTNMAWPTFFLTLFVGYVVINTIFATLYFLFANGELTGADAPTAVGRFFNVFFFSAQTLSTVGYGGIAPKGLTANMIAAFEAMIGVLAFAVATGLLFGRVSRPSAKIGYSEHMLIAPYQDGTSLQFRVVNRRENDIMELEARVLLMTVESKNGGQVRKYRPLKLERERVLFLPLTWTVVHPIDEESPLRGLTAEDFEQRQVEFLILIKGYDDTFSQTVLSRFSYRHEEVLWGRHFGPAFDVDTNGDLFLDLQKVGEIADPA